MYMWNFPLTTSEFFFYLSLRLASVLTILEYKVVKWTQTPNFLFVYFMSLIVLFTKFLHAFFKQILLGDDFWWTIIIFSRTGERESYQVLVNFL
jgi:hypothetical protein